MAAFEPIAAKWGDLGSMGDSCSRFEEVGDSLTNLARHFTMSRPMAVRGMCAFPSASAVEPSSSRWSKSPALCARKRDRMYSGSYTLTAGAGVVSVMETHPQNFSSPLYCDAQSSAGSSPGAFGEIDFDFCLSERFSFGRAIVRHFER